MFVVKVLCIALLLLSPVLSKKKSKASLRALSPLYPSTTGGTLTTYTGTLSDPSSGRTIADVKGRVLSKWINETAFKREGKFEYLEPGKIQGSGKPMWFFKPTETSKPRPVNSTTTTSRHTTPIQKRSSPAPSSLISTSPHSTLLGTVTPSSPSRFEIFWRPSPSPLELKRLKLGLNSTVTNVKRKIISFGKFKGKGAYGSRELYEFNGENSKKQKTVRYSRYGECPSWYAINRMCCLEMEGVEEDGSKHSFEEISSDPDHVSGERKNIQEKVGIWAETVTKTVLGWVRISV
ncbi:hypothetical protein TrLO_g3998 [Triparma laevis f. longispina]|nr:hypothetical protein TrLO_g3998 [Triparma laevis f. longispina]